MPNIIPIPSTGTYQGPGFVQPNQYPDLPGSIDALFNAYQKTKLNEQQLQGSQFQNQANQANFALQNQGLTPQDINQNIGAAMRPGPNPNSFYATPVQPPTTAPGFQQSPAMTQPNMPWNGNQGQPVPQEDPKITTLRNIMQMHLQSQQFGALEAGAKLEETTAGARAKNAEAAQTEAINRMFNDAGGDAGTVVDNLYNRLKAGEPQSVVLGEIPARGPYAALKVAVINKAAANGLNLSKNETSFAGEKSGAQTSQMPIRMGKAILPNLDKLDQLAEKNAGTSWQTINKYGIKLAVERGDPGANQIATQAAIISDEVQAMFGSGSDAKLDLAVNLLSTAKTKQQLKDSTGLLRTAIQNRLKALQGENPENESSSKWNGGDTHVYPDGTKARWNGSQWVKEQ